jgi:cell filamentation protein
MSPLASDPYCYPGTDVLINKGDYRIQAELDEFEADAVLLAVATLRIDPIAGPFDTLRLQEAHRRIFANVYAWAGELRKDIGMMAKTRPSGFVVAYGPSEHVLAVLAIVFAALQAEHFLLGLDAGAMADRLAYYYYSELDAIHAFREGNSRTLRVLTSDLAHAAGYRLDWASAAQTAEQRERLYRARDLAVVRGDTSALARLIDANLRKAPPCPN